MKKLFVFFCMSIGFLTIGGIGANATSATVSNTPTIQAKASNPKSIVKLSGQYCGWKDSNSILLGWSLKQVNFASVGDKIFGRVKIYDYYAGQWRWEYTKNWDTFTPQRGRVYWAHFEAVVVRNGIEYINDTYTHGFST